MRQRTGANSAARLRPTDAPSSAVETTGAPNPAVPTFTTGRAAAFPACTSPDTMTPRTMPTHGCSAIHTDWSTSSAAAVAAKISPPMAGRMKVCTASLTVSTAGILSSTTSLSSSREPMPIAHQLSIQA